MAEIHELVRDAEEGRHDGRQREPMGQIREVAEGTAAEGNAVAQVGRMATRLAQVETVGALSCCGFSKSMHIN